MPGHDSLGKPVTTRTNWTTPFLEDLQKNDLIRHKKHRGRIATITQCHADSVIVLWPNGQYTELLRHRLPFYETRNDPHVA